jgi:hypothetical protein
MRRILNFIFGFFIGTVLAGRLRSGIRARLALKPLELNRAEAEELVTVFGLDRDVADRIVENRPYRNKMDLLSRMIVPEDIYNAIKGRITVTREEAIEPVKVA